MPSWESAWCVENMLPLPIQFVLFMLVGWVSRYQQQMIEYLMTENAAFRDQLGGKRIRFTDAQCRRFARAAPAFCVNPRCMMPRKNVPVVITTAPAPKYNAPPDAVQ
ncbi:MAG: hypothetical protein HC794_01775 [Nitrospiraceae bacterium]|nr:hypothetical protein [Nitrospiraceae bacterium]